MDAAARGWGNSAALAFRLLQFTIERFPPVAYGSLIVALVACGAATAVLPGGDLALGFEQAAVLVAVTAAFLQLRILDEIRDAAADRVGQPDRPLPRGLVTADELRSLALLAAVVGLAVTLPLGAAAVAAYTAALGTIWAFGLELYRSLPVRFGPVGIAMLHSIVAPLVLVFTVAAHGGAASAPILLTALVLVWGASLGVEFGRKTLLPSEERAGLESYSAALGRRRAAGLTAAALGVALGGASAVAAIAGAGAGLLAGPLVLAAVSALAAGPLLDRLGTPVIRGGSGATALVALLWPVVVSVAGVA